MPPPFDSLILIKKIFHHFWMLTKNSPNSFYFFAGTNLPQKKIYQQIIVYVFFIKLKLIVGTVNFILFPLIFR